MSVTFTKFENLSEDIAKKVHNFNTDTLNIYLSNAAPDVAAHTVKANIAEIATGAGYSGPIDAQNSTNRSGSTTSINGVDPADVTASGGTIGPFRYAILYNDTPTSPADPLIGYWDYGSAITLQDGESLAIDLVAVGDTIFTIT